jgi:hypothetical protein
MTEPNCPRIFTKNIFGQLRAERSGGRTLPPAIRAGIVAMVGAAGEPNTNQGE